MSDEVNQKLCFPDAPSDVANGNTKVFRLMVVAVVAAPSRFPVTDRRIPGPDFVRFEALRFRAHSKCTSEE